MPYSLVMAEDRKDHSSGPMKPKESNPFKYLDLYPDALKVLHTKSQRVKDIKDKAIVVLDTNSLLIPYGTSQHTLSVIKNIYAELSSANRLIVPAHVLREFAANRTNKIQSVYQSLSKSSDIQLPSTSIALLEEEESYVKLMMKRRVLDESIKQYKRQLTDVLNRIKEWNWNDPVSDMYSEIFNEHNVHEIDINKEELKEEAARRSNGLIPPGYKDLSKSENPYGDLIIWKTLLDIGTTYQLPVLFISHDEKSDWWMQSNNTAIYPRYELVYEFKNITGQDLYIAKLSELMNINKLNTDSILEVATEETDSTSVFQGFSTHQPANSIKHNLSSGKGNISWGSNSLGFEFVSYESDRNYTFFICFIDYDHKEGVEELELQIEVLNTTLLIESLDPNVNPIAVLVFNSEETVYKYKYGSTSRIERFPVIVSLFLRKDQFTLGYIESGRDKLPTEILSLNW